MIKASLLLLLSLLSFSLGFTVNYGGNVSLANQDEYKFRLTAVNTINAGALSGAFLTSAVVDVSKGASADFFASAAFAGVGVSPSTYAVYFGASADANATGPLSLNFAASRAFVLSTYVKVEEVDISGKVVKEESLSGAYTVPDKKVDSTGLSFFVIQSASLLSKFSFSFTAVFSAKVGVLDVVGKPIVTPKSLETLLSLSGWEYTNATNQLVLSIGVASASLKVDGNAQFSAGGATDGVYVKLASVAKVDGKEANVKVSALADATADGLNSGILTTAINAKYGQSASFKIVKVTFPAGAATIEYDPTIGAGAHPPQEGSAAHLGIFLVFVLALLF